MNMIRLVAKKATVLIIHYISGRREGRFLVFKTFLYVGLSSKLLYTPMLPAYLEYLYIHFKKFFLLGCKVN